MSPGGDDKMRSTQSHGIGGGGGGPRVSEETASHDAKVLLENSLSVPSADLLVGKEAPLVGPKSKAQQESKESSRLIRRRDERRMAHSDSRESRRSGFFIDLEALKIFVILTALTVAMVVAARWIV